MVAVSSIYLRQRTMQFRNRNWIWSLSVLLVLLGTTSFLPWPETTTTSQHGICLMVRAEDDGEAEDVEAEEYETDEEGGNEAIIDAMTGESILPQDDEEIYASSLLHNNDIHGRNSMEERDPNLRLMTYDVGDGEQTTYVYVEPTIEEMYRTSDQHVHQRVTPQFNGFAGKFINMSNKKCTLYWYVYTMYTCILCVLICSLGLEIICHFATLT